MVSCHLPPSRGEVASAASGRGWRDVETESAPFLTFPRKGEGTVLRERGNTCRFLGRILPPKTGTLDRWRGVFPGAPRLNAPDLLIKFGAIFACRQIGPIGAPARPLVPGRGPGWPGLAAENQKKKENPP